MTLSIQYFIRNFNLTILLFIGSISNNKIHTEIGIDLPNTDEITVLPETGEWYKDTWPLVIIPPYYHINGKQKTKIRKQKTKNTKIHTKKKNPSNGMQSNSRSNLHFQYIRNLCIQLIFDIIFFLIFANNFVTCDLKSILFVLVCLDFCFSVCVRVCVRVCVVVIGGRCPYIYQIRKYCLVCAFVHVVVESKCLYDVNVANKLIILRSSL